MKFREVERAIEKERLLKEEENFKKIKPERNTSINDAKCFIDNLFNSMRGL